MFLSNDAKKTGSELMEHMRDFWAREWLLRSIAMRHDTHKPDEIIKIATTAGYICSNGNLTKTVVNLLNSLRMTMKKFACRAR